MRRPEQIVRRLLATAAVLAMSTGGAVACAICLAAVNVSLGQRIDNADQVVLVARSAPDMPPEIAAILKGDAISGDIFAVGDGEDVPAPGSGQALVFVRDRLGQSWSVLGSVGLEQAAWITQFAATPEPPDFSHSAFPDMAWLQRLGLVMRERDNQDPFVSELVTGELMRAPYSALRAVGARHSAQDLLAQIDGDGPKARHAPFYAMLGAAGDADHAVLVEERLRSALQRSDTTDVAAMLAADLDLRGVERVDWVEENYLLDRARSIAEVEAAMTALHVHADIDRNVARAWIIAGVGKNYLPDRARTTADGEAASMALHGNSDMDLDIPRARIVGAFRRLIRERPPMAGFVARDLTEWEEWGATADYIALLASGSVTDPASEFAIRSYIGQSPDVAARSALELIQ